MAKHADVQLSAEDAVSRSDELLARLVAGYGYTSIGTFLKLVEQGRRHLKRRFPELLQAERDALRRAEAEAKAKSVA